MKKKKVKKPHKQQQQKKSPHKKTKQQHTHTHPTRITIVIAILTADHIGLALAPQYYAKFMYTTSGTDIRVTGSSHSKVTAGIKTFLASPVTDLLFFLKDTEEKSILLLLKAEAFKRLSKRCDENKHKIHKHAKIAKNTLYTYYKSIS